jgi:hypothetical protein
MTSTAPRRAPPRDAIRPGCLTAVCCILAVGAVIWLFLGLGYNGPRGRWFSTHYLLQALAMAAVVVGLWRMRKWGVVAFAILAALVHLLYLFTGLLNLETFLIYGFTLGPAIYYYKRMR